MNEQTNEVVAAVERALFVTSTPAPRMPAASRLPQLNAMKNDVGKTRFELLPADALEEIAKVFTHGAQKYEDFGWMRGLKWGRLIGAAQRHLIAFTRGETFDPDTGLSHLAHCISCLMMLEAHRLQGLGHDDRVALPPSSHK